MSRKYQVRSGDTLTGIAQRFYGDGSLFELIANANRLADPDVIPVGQVLSIPEPPAHWDVVQSVVWFYKQKTGWMVTKVPCVVPAGMRLVIENVSARYVAQQGILFPLALGEPNPLGEIDAPLACFPWIPAGDVLDPANEPVWFAFNCDTKIYIDGPVDGVTFGAGYRGFQGHNGIADGRLCISGHLEAQPPG